MSQPQFLCDLYIYIFYTSVKGFRCITKYIQVYIHIYIYVYTPTNKNGSLHIIKVVILWSIAGVELTSCSNNNFY